MRRVGTPLSPRSLRLRVSVFSFHLLTSRDAAGRLAAVVLLAMDGPDMKRFSK